jgi:hypothetical protein
MKIIAERNSLKEQIVYFKQQFEKITDRKGKEDESKQHH